MSLWKGTAIHDLLPPYDVNKRASSGDLPAIGQIVRTIVPDLTGRFHVWDAMRSDSTSHTSASGELRALRDVDYRPKPNRLPVFNLSLGVSEELLAIRSKLRPTIVLAKSEAIPESALPVGVERNKGREAFRHPSYLVAPIYSVSAGFEHRAFGATVAARAQCLVYPQFVYLPQSGGIISNDSVARLDRAFWTTIQPPSVPEQLFVSDVRMGLIAGQLLVLQGLAPTQEYIETVELVRAELPPQFEA